VSLTDAQRLALVLVVPFFASVLALFATLVATVLLFIVLVLYAVALSLYLRYAIKDYEETIERDIQLLATFIRTTVAAA